MNKQDNSNFHHLHMKHTPRCVYCDRVLLQAELATLRGELEEANYRLDRFSESEHALVQETIEALKRAEAGNICDGHRVEEATKCPYCMLVDYQELVVKLTKERDAAHAAGRREAVERCVEIAEHQILPKAHQGIALACNMARKQIASAIRAEFGGEEC